MTPAAQNNPPQNGQQPGGPQIKEPANTLYADTLYNEAYRPQFHFSARQNWLNDPNGLVYYKGEYHLFFQHNPFGREWGNMTWGHAVSPDLLHWQQLPNALTPDALGTMFSGSAVVDADNTADFQKGREKTLVALYTAAGGTSPESKGQPFTQCLAYSRDRGRTWTKYAGNPVLKHIAGENRDPKVVWHAPSKQWILALYLEKSDFALFASPDLEHWTHLQDLTLPGCDECPDFFPLTASSDEEGKKQGRKARADTTESGAGQAEPAAKWVFTAANGHYLVGDFDGQKFTPDGPIQQADWGANFYAVQTYSDAPGGTRRRTQIAWMRDGKYPHMPFNQQMSFPCDLTLRDTPEGLRLYRWPVPTLSKLVEKTQSWKNLTLAPGANPLSSLRGDLWDVEAEFELQDATEFGLVARGEAVRYNVTAKTLTCLGRTAPLAPVGNRVRMRLLVDRSSLEAFGNGGRVSLTSCFLPPAGEQGLGVFAAGGKVKVLSLTVRSLKSAIR